MEESKVVEIIIKGLIKEEVDPVQILIGLYKVFEGGDILAEAGFDFDDDDLNELLDRIELIIDSMRTITKEY